MKDLTTRELEVLKLMNFSDKEISGILVVESTTIKTHIKNIMSKLHTSNRTHTLIKALKENIIQLDDLITEYKDRANEKKQK